jgi:phage replication-related protein YjqB (UPF0714/DUF867 family)
MSLFKRTDSDRSTSPLTADGLTVTAREVPSDYHEVIGSSRYERENIVIHPDLTTRSSLVRRQNLRLIEPNQNHVAIYTAAHEDTSVGNPTDIWVGPDGWARLGLTSSDAPVELQLDTTSTRTDLTESEAQSQGEVIELVEDDGSQSNMMVFAYHGGNMEALTYDQAKTMKDRIQNNSANASLYGWKGYTDGDDPVSTFDKWHITSVDVHPESHTNLNSVKDRGFSYTLSFHGFSDNDRVAIGGLASSTFKGEIQTVIQNATGSEITVDIVSSDSYIAGQSPRNILNRVASTDTTIQIEQSTSARQDYGTQIAQALADHYLNNVFP